jgi:hypothetical protein
MRKNKSVNVDVISRDSLEEMSLHNLKTFLKCTKKEISKSEQDTKNVEKAIDRGAESAVKIENFPHYKIR